MKPYYFRLQIRSFSIPFPRVKILCKHVPMENNVNRFKTAWTIIITSVWISYVVWWIKSCNILVMSIVKDKIGHSFYYNWKNKNDGYTRWMDKWLFFLLSIINIYVSTLKSRKIHPRIEVKGNGLCRSCGNGTRGHRR